MQKLWKVGMMSGVFFLAIAGHSFAAEDDEQAVREATANFYAALNEMFTGDVSAMMNVWSHGDDVTYMGPGGGIEIGWEHVQLIWKKQAALKLGGEVKPQSTYVLFGRDLAFSLCLEVGDNVVDGKPQQVSIRATNVFRKENGQWKMIGHHTDLLPFLQ